MSAMTSKSKNDITGDSLISKVNTDAFNENFDRIFGKKEKPRYVPPPLPDTNHERYASVDNDYQKLDN